VGQICPQSYAFRRGEAERVQENRAVVGREDKAMLSAPQLQKLLDLRQDQKRELEGIIAKQKSEQV
jgi:hypothetical protein